MSAAVILGVLGGTTWISGGFWSPDGVFAQFISPAIFLVWILVVSWVLMTRASSSPNRW
jgi:hypothetical protein